MINRKDRLKRYLKNKYYRDDKKVIELKIDSEEQLYNKYDSSSEMIDRDITSYLEATTEALLPLGEINICIKSPKKCDVEKFKRSLNMFYGVKILNVERYATIKRKKEAVLLLIAALSFIIALSTVDIVSSIFSFIGTLSIWQFTDMIIFRDEEKIVKEFVYDILEDASVYNVLR